MRCAHDRAVWPLACSRRWTERNLTRGLRPPLACHALRLRSLRRSRACAATANQHAVSAADRIVAVHASGRFACAHGRRVVSEMETTWKGPGVIRRYLPKRSRIEPSMAADVQAIVDETNNRPMWVLGCRTPAEAFADELLELTDKQGRCTSK